MFSRWLSGIPFFIVMLLSVFVFRSFLWEPFTIPTGSMIPTLMVGDYLFVSKFAYGYSRYSFPLALFPFSGRFAVKDPIQRGDVAVFRHESSNEDYVKRVIGLPGDCIQLKDGVIYINNVPVERESIKPYYLADEDKYYPAYRETLPNHVSYIVLNAAHGNGLMDNTGVYVVPTGHYFVMGDNRDLSSDSRFLDQVGFIPAEDFVGRVTFVLFSFDYLSPWLSSHFRSSRFFHFVH